MLVMVVSCSCRVTKIFSFRDDVIQPIRDVGFYPDRGIPMFGFGRKKKAPASREQKARQVSAPSSGINGSLLSLEQRLMFDAAASATASEVATEQVAQEQAEAVVSANHPADGPSAPQAESQGLLDAIATYNPGESRSEVVFVDPTVPNYEALLSGMDPHVKVIMLDGGQDGIEQMANALSNRTGIDAIHVISHGGAGELQLGTGVLSADTMSTDYADDLAVIQQALSEQADILVYGCEFAKGDAGQARLICWRSLRGLMCRQVMTSPAASRSAEIGNSKSVWARSKPPWRSATTCK